jgi:hypothetical protein
MRNKTEVAKEDPEAKARREVEEARADADKTSALQQILDRRTRKILRIFGKPQGGASSGTSGVPGRVSVANMGGGFMAGAGGGGGIGDGFDVVTSRDLLNSEGGYGQNNQFWY